LAAASDGGSPDAEAGEADTVEGAALRGRAVRGILVARKVAERLISHLAGDGTTSSRGLLDDDTSMEEIYESEYRACN
jgi:hypothetical protein